MAYLTSTFRVHLIDGHSFEIQASSPNPVWDGKRECSHESIPARWIQFGGIWKDDKFYPIHRIEVIEWLGTPIHR